MKQTSKHRITRVALGGVLAFALLLGAVDMRAMAEDDDDPALDTKILRDVLRSLGLRRGDENAIDYRERSPLVVPPSRILPSPETAAPNRGPAWPNDPDVKRAREAKAARAKANPDPVDDSRPLRPDQYNRTAPPSPSSQPDGRDRPDASKPMSPAELDAKNVFNSLWRSKEEYATFGGEPPRASLTEPPTGYRTPSPNQPYGVGKQKWDYKPVDHLEPVR